jgi:hypothetical protein
MSRIGHEYEYLSLEEALEVLKGTREHQTRRWPSTTLHSAGGRPFEEWIVLIDNYMAKLKQVYSETPCYVGDGDELNIEGLKRIEKYMAVVANLAIWGVQAAKGRR